MKILVVGAGLTGCTFARLLKNKKHEVFIIEKLDHIGGLCYSKRNLNGLLYEPFGAHTFHASEENIINFVRSFSKFNSYKHSKGIIINGVLRHYPLSIQTIKEMPESNQILKELSERPKKPDRSNFETYMISLFGSILYKLFIYNYTKKMWSIEPKELSTEWVINRIELRKFNSSLFNNNFQGLPIGGYTQFFNKMILGIPIKYNCKEFYESYYDLVLFSGKIDDLFDYKFGILPYRSLRFEYSKNDSWENEKYGTINLPQDLKYIRKVNFKILHQQKSNHIWVQYQEPVIADNINLPMYPIHTKKNINLFIRYLKKACQSDKIIPVGRLGLYKYLDMDQAILLAMNMLQLIEDWKSISSLNRYLRLKKLINF